MTIGKWVGVIVGLFLMYGFYLGVTGVDIIVYTLLTIQCLIYIIIQCSPKDVFKGMVLSLKGKFTGFPLVVGILTSGLWVYVGMLTQNTTFLYFYSFALILSYSTTIRAFLTKTDEV